MTHRKAYVPLNTGDGLLPSGIQDKRGNKEDSNGTKNEIWTILLAKSHGKSIVCVPRDSFGIQARNKNSRVEDSEAVGSTVDAMSEFAYQSSSAIAIYI